MSSDLLRNQPTLTQIVVSDQIPIQNYRIDTSEYSRGALLPDPERLPFLAEFVSTTIRAAHRAGLQGHFP